MRILTADMPEGMVERILDAGAMWTSAAVRFSMIVQTSGEPGPGTIAVGVVVPQGRAGTFHYMKGPYLSTCRIVIDLSAGPWYTGTETPPAGMFDTQTIIAHELGHCLGLGHSDVNDPPVLMRTLIHAGEWQRNLSADDLAGREALFPLPPPRRRSGCAVFR